TMVEQLGKSKNQDVLEIAGREVSLADILHTIKVMGQCIDEMRCNDTPRLGLELYSLRLTQPFVDAGELLRRLEKLEKTSGEVKMAGESVNRLVGDSVPAPAVSIPPPATPDSSESPNHRITDSPVVDV